MSIRMCDTVKKRPDATVTTLRLVSWAQRVRFLWGGGVRLEGTEANVTYGRCEIVVFKRVLQTVPTPETKQIFYR